MKSRQRSLSKIRVLDLFSGAGGLGMGFGGNSKYYQVLRAVELDRHAASTYQANNAHVNVFVGRIEEWLVNEEIPESDIIIGGPPCQGFSSLGKKNQLDSRNQLWTQYAETIRRSRPQFFVLENVPAFLSSTQRDEFYAQCQAGGPLAEYTFQARVLNAADYGTAQIRKRAILIGHHRDIPFPGFPEPTHSKHGDALLAQWHTVGDALEGIRADISATDLPDRLCSLNGAELPGVFRTNELHLTRNYQQLSLDRFSCISPGGNRFDIRDDLLPVCWKNHRSGSSDVMGRLVFNKPSVTIRTEFFKPEKGRYLHPTENRAITHHEAARLQGFPDDYNWIGSKVTIARQIGNAVPISLANALGLHLGKAFVSPE